MKDLHWEEMPLEARKEVWEAYAAYLLEKEGTELTWEQADACWTGSRWMTIYFTFSTAYLK